MVGERKPTSFFAAHRFLFGPEKLYCRYHPHCFAIQRISVFHLKFNVEFTHMNFSLTQERCWVTSFGFEIRKLCFAQHLCLLLKQPGGTVSILVHNGNYLQLAQ